MTRLSILVLSDAGFAGRALLGRRDVELRWALTRREAIAALRRKPFPKLALAREELALDYLKDARKEPGAPPCLVLAEPKGLQRAQTYFAAGATVIAAESAEARVLEAIAGLTGLAFRQMPRVPFSTVVDLAIGEQRLFLESVDLSTSGVTVRGLPLSLAQVGMRAELHLMMLEPALTATGVVTRAFEEAGEMVGALSFEVISPQDRSRITALVEEERKKAPSLPEPVGLTSDLSGQFTLDLHQQMLTDDRAVEAYRTMLTERIRRPGAVARVPTWLERIGRSLTDCERAAILGRPAPDFTRATIEARIRLYRLRIEEGAPRERDTVAAIELCNGLAQLADREPEPVLADVTEIRAALLREIYGAPVTECLEIVGVDDARARPVGAGPLVLH